MKQFDDSTCDSVRALMEDLIAEGLSGGLSGGQAARVLVHLRQCDACSELLELHARLSHWKGHTQGATEDQEPSAPEFGDMRDEVLRTLERDGLVRLSEGTPSQRNRAARWRPALAAALALAIFALGWWTGDRKPSRGLSSKPAKLADSVALDQLILDDLMQGLLVESQLTPDAADLRPYELQDVRVRALQGSRVAISFDVATHLELERSKDDPLVTEALVQSILGSSDLGGRLNAISQTSESLSPRVTAALVQAMLQDDSVAVRMQAQQRLAESLPKFVPDSSQLSSQLSTRLSSVQPSLQPGRQAFLETSPEAFPDARVEDAFLLVLEKEESVQMRLVAIDVLTAYGVASERLRDAMAVGLPEPGNALRLHVGNYLNRL